LTDTRETKDYCAPSPKDGRSFSNFLTRANPMREDSRIERQEKAEGTANINEFPVGF
jgi:hypothetical protein